MIFTENLLQMITAIKNGVTRNFPEEQWKNLPKDKFGWVITDPGQQPETKPTTDIIQQTMEAGKVVTAPVPYEIILGKTETMKGMPAKGTQMNDDLPEIKRRPGRQKK